MSTSQEMKETAAHLAASCLITWLFLSNGELHNSFQDTDHAMLKPPKSALTKEQTQRLSNLSQNIDPKNHSSNISTEALPRVNELLLNKSYEQNNVSKTASINKFSNSNQEKSMDINRSKVKLEGK